MSITPDSPTAAAVRGALAARRVKQTQVAEKLGISQPAVSKRLSGQRQFSIAEIQLLAEWLDVPVGDLIGRAS
jgi:transcriptional regulator with XRE-family HTH domain